ncbi:MAG: anaerobic nitric oxide reductase flavorubredoxin [Candidatus Hydrogenedentes bacterium]|nr:anaerobic nitric oxide reductase flavorubredoxin [Candidatus Hydrogenedentota bacterium]
MVVELKQGVYWVGVVDWGLKHFHGHELSTHRGSSYNSYLIKDEKTALVDTVWSPFTKEFIENVREVVDPASIDIVVANHSEVDHSGALPEIMRLCPNAQLIVSRKGADSFEGHYHQGWNLTTVKTGDRVSLGANELVFVEAPMLHWPDSMFTYLTGKNILMPNDAFGQHYATAFRFNDQVDQAELYEEALKYYVNILTPFSKLVTAKIDEVLALGLPVDIIAPSHGVIWRDNPLQIVTQYQAWAKQTPETRAVILFDSMWNATRRMAEAIGDGLAVEGVDHTIQHMALTDRNDALVEVFRSRAVVIGSPTLNRGVLPSISPLLTDLKGLNFQNKIGAAFGSHGWHNQSVKAIEDHFAQCGIPVVAEGVTCKWQPTADDLERCRAFGRTIAEAVKKPL